MNAMQYVLQQELDYIRRTRASKCKTVRRTMYATDKGDHGSAVEYFKESFEDTIFDEILVSSLCNITRRKLFEYHQRGTGITAFESDITCNYNSTRHSRNLLHYHKEGLRNQ